MLGLYPKVVTEVSSVRFNLTFWWIISSKNMILLLVYMVSGGGKGRGVGSVNLLVVIIGILFIVNSDIGASIIMGWGLGK